MPLKVVPPREGRSRNYRLRGTYLGVAVDESAGTHSRKAAEAYKRRRERDIERGIDSDILRQGGASTFAEAALTYLAACPDREAARVDALLAQFPSHKLRDFSQAVIRQGAIDRYPPGPTNEASPRNATINREYLSPLSAILRLAARNELMPVILLQRYPEPPGRVRFESPDVVEAFLQALPATAATVSGKYKGKVRYPRACAVFLFATGARLGAAIGRLWPDIDLEARHVHLGIGKNGEPDSRALHAAAVVELARLPHRVGSVFGYKTKWEVYRDWDTAKAAIGLEDFTPHDARHTFASWARQYGKIDLRGLMDLGGWKSYQSVIRYTHVASEERRETVDRLPLRRR